MSGIKLTGVLDQGNTNLPKAVDILLLRNAFSFKEVSNNSVYGFSKNINVNKMTSWDPVKIAEDQLAEPHTCIINPAITHYFSKQIQRSFGYTK